MHIYSSDRFISVAASGTDWRDTSKNILECLQAHRTENDNFNFGLIYITDSLTENAGSILDLFRSVTGIENWIGAVGLGVYGVGCEFLGEPAISVMAGNINPDDFHVFSAGTENDNVFDEELLLWSDKNDVFVSLVHGSREENQDPVGSLSALGKQTGMFVVGGLSSSRTDPLHFARGVREEGISGAVFSPSVSLVTTMAQGCAPVGDIHVITSCDAHVVYELDGRPAFDVFSDDMKALAEKQTDKKPQEIVVADERQGEHPSRDFDDVSCFRGELHVAFPVSGSDQVDYIVRNIAGIDPDDGSFTVPRTVNRGDRILFVHRDHDTVTVDLTKTLLDLRERVKKEQGSAAFNPKGAVYISCAARTLSEFHGDTDSEIELVREIIGNVPLTGFYANGEISNRRLYEYSAVLILFL